MANYNYDTITADQAARFNPATDTVTFSGVSASDVGVVFGDGNIPNVSIFLGGRGVVFPATAYTAANFIFSDASQLLLGTAGNNTLATAAATPNGAGVYGGAGNDTSNLTGRDVFLQGNAGTDTLTISASGFGTVYGGMGNDTISISSSAASILNGNMGVDSINITGTGDNSVYGGMDGDLITVGGAASGDNFVSGDLGGDAFTVTGAGANTVFGGEGNDTILANGTGDYFLHGNAGSDAISVIGGGDNSIYGGQGGDTITLNTGAAGDNFISGDLGADTISVTGSGSNTVYGGDGDDAITVAGGVAGESAALVNGNAGNDTIIVSGAGEYTVGGGQGNDLIDANSSAAPAATGDNVLNGDLGNDTIIGGTGADTITGGAGVDVLTGSAGADQFVFTGLANASTQGDIVTDFATTSDTITFGTAAGSAVNFAEVTQGAATSYDLALATANTALNGVVTYAYVTNVTADFDGSGAQVTGSVLFADTNGDGTADAAIRLTGLGTGDVVFSDIV